MYTKYQQYMSGVITHREFYGQFVNESVKVMVRARISLKRLLASKDPHLNDIPLEEWDRIYIVLPIQRLKSTGMTNVNTPSVKVCILKEAARQLIEEHKNISTMIIEDQNEAG